MHKGNCNNCSSGEWGPRTPVPQLQERQAKINDLVAEIAIMKSKLNKALQENKKLKSLFSPEKNGRGHDKSIWCYVHAGLPGINKGYSIPRGLRFYRQA